MMCIVTPRSTKPGSIVNLELFALLVACLLSVGSARNGTGDCVGLQPGQYYCADPDIDPDTQHARGCDPDTRSVRVPCYPVRGLNCGGFIHTGDSIGFYSTVQCDVTSGRSFSVALLLSIFLGFLGADRFYLGYPALGLLKLCTFGCMFIGQLIDILLIALQVVGDADGTAYVIDAFGASLTYIQANNETYVKPPG